MPNPNIRPETSQINIMWNEQNEIVVKDKKDVLISSLYKENGGWTEFYYYLKDTLGLVEILSNLTTTFTKSDKYPNLSDTPAWFYYWKAIENTKDKEEGKTADRREWKVELTEEKGTWTRIGTGTRTLIYLKGNWIGNKSNELECFLPIYDINKKDFYETIYYRTQIKLLFYNKQLDQFNQILEDFRTYAKNQQKIIIKGFNYTIKEKKDKSKDEWEDLGYFEIVGYREEYSTSVILFINPSEFESRIDKTQKIIKKIAFKRGILSEEDKENLVGAKKIRLGVNIGNETYALLVNESEEALHVYGKECNIEVLEEKYKVEESQLEAVIEYTAQDSFK